MIAPPASHVYRPSLLTNGLLGIAQILVWGGSFFLLSVLADPIIKDTGWSRQGVYGSLSLGMLISGLAAPWMGKKIANVGNRTLLYSGFVIGAGLMVLAVAPVFPVFVLGWCIIGFGMAMGLYDALFAVLGKQYGLEAKGAITQITLISGFCTTVIWPLLAWMIQHLDWRTATAAYALLLWVVIWPLYKLALPEKQSGGEEPERMAAPAAPRSPSSVDSVTFWLLAVNFTIAAAIMTAISVQLLDVLQARGLSLSAAIGIGSLIGPCQVGVRLLDVLGPKKHPIWSTLISSALVTVGLGLLGMDPALATAGVVLYSLGNGMRSILRGTLPLELFGPDPYPVVLGRLARPSLVAQALTPLIGAYLLEQYGALALLMLLVGLAVVNVVVTAAIKYRISQAGTLTVRR